MGWFILFIILGLLYSYFNSKEKEKYLKKHEEKKQEDRRKFVEATKDDPLKIKGDKYERHIGKRFEEKGDLVIYNGFIQGLDDGGVDVAAISPDGTTINLIQCKNWTNMKMELYHIKTIYQKLLRHNLDFLSLPIEDIKIHLDRNIDEEAIKEAISTVRQNKKNLTIRKTLYIASDKVIDLEIGKHLTMIKPHIFRYEDMKIVVERV